MFDLRYHVASLVAVFVALIVGILVGVGLAGSGVTKKADLKAAQLHGTETPADAELVRRKVGYLIKAFPAGSDRNAPCTL